MVRQLLVPLLCAAAAVALPAASTASATIVADFSLFAYGRGLGGHRVVEKDGSAYIVTSPFPNDCKNVTFHSGGNGRTLEARIGDDDATEALFAVPSTAGGALTFARRAANASVRTTGFGLYDSFLFVNLPGNGMAMDWFARPAAGARDTWELGWKLDAPDAVPVALRSMAPSKPAGRDA